MKEYFASIPWAIAALATLVGLTLVFALDVTRRRRQMERIGHSPMLQKMTASLSTRRRTTRAILYTLGAVGVVVAMAHPLGSGQTKWQQRGIDVALVLDYSKSMLARDVYPTRLERMELEVDELIDELKSDRIATVLFAGAAVHFPLTHDHKAAKLLWSGFTPADLPPGSDIGEAMRVARCLLRPDVMEGACAQVGGRGRGGDPLGPETTWSDPAKTQTPQREPDKAADRARAIVLVTDGEDTENLAGAEIQEAVRLGIDVYVVGIGTVAGELVPEVDENGKITGWKKLPDGSFVTTRLDQAKLKELAQLAGGDGRYYVIDSKSRGLDDLTTRLKRLKEGNLDERAIKTFEERFQWVLFPAFMLLVIEACTSDRRRRGRPR
jgi:Ca-activated chloride channel family protein